MAGLFEFVTDMFNGARPRPGAINENLGGDELAAWLAARLREKGFNASEPWAEDHGYDFDVSADGRRYLVVCARDFDDEAENPGRHWIVVSLLRRPLDILLFRGKIAREDRLIRFVDEILRSENRLRNLTYVFEG